VGSARTGCSSPATARGAITPASSHVSRQQLATGELGRMVLRDNFHDSLPLIWDASISNLSSP
jgi:hypothetical protein